MRNEKQIVELLQGQGYITTQGAMEINGNTHNTSLVKTLKAHNVRYILLPCSHDGGRNRYMWFKEDVVNVPHHVCKRHAKARNGDEQEDGDQELVALRLSMRALETRVDALEELKNLTVTLP